jgi:hypothetical protein
VRWSERASELSVAGIGWGYFGSCTALQYRVKRPGRLARRRNSVQLGVLDAQNEVYDDGSEKGDGEDGRAKAVVEAALSAATDTLCSPVEGDDGVDHGAHGDDGEEGGGDATDAIAKVQQTNGETAEDDGEVQPREKGALVGEEDLWLDAGREGDALAWRCVVSQCQSFLCACICTWELIAGSVLGGIREIAVGSLTRGSLEERLARHNGGETGDRRGDGGVKEGVK